MINFSDLSNVANKNVTQPVANAKQIGYQMMEKSLQSMESSIKEEAAATRIVMDELLKSGKVEFMGGSRAKFQEEYKKQKQELLNKMKNFSSIQGFLNNGGYEHIADFKNNLENSDAYQTGIVSRIQQGVIEHMLKNGKEVKFEEPDAYAKWLKGERDTPGYAGIYNSKDIDPKDLILSKGETEEKWTDEALTEYLKSNDYSPERIKKAVEASNLTGGFTRVMKDEILAFKREQLEAKIDYDNRKLLFQEQKDAGLNAYRMKALQLREKADEMESDYRAKELAFKKTKENNTEEWRNKTMAQRKSEQEALDKYRQEVLDAKKLADDRLNDYRAKVVTIKEKEAGIKPPVPATNPANPAPSATSGPTKVTMPGITPLVPPPGTPKKQN